MVVTCLNINFADIYMNSINFLSVTINLLCEILAFLSNV